MATVKIAHAVSDENKKARGGSAGDQTGKEVCVWEWYDKPWTHVIRAKKDKHCEKIAAIAEAIVANDNIGYDQAQRTTLFDEAVKVKYKIAKIKVPCETDCSAMVAVCVNGAGITVSKDMYTGIEADLLRATGKFDIFVNSRYTRKTLWLRRGDILLGKGHTAIVINDCAIFTRELKVGCIGIDVRNLQLALTDLNYNCGPIDGEFGEKTRKAVEKYQSAHVLKTDCVVGKKTITEMGLAWKG